jgi:enamine deaminase RidA (YjgF/YER057c/UK114 family)
MAPKAITSKELGPALGMYSHGMIVPAGEIVVVAGQVGVNRAGEVAGAGDVVAQTTQAFENVRAVLTAAGCAMTDVVRFQTFLTHATDIDGFMQARRELFPRYFPGGVYPPNTLLIISRLVKPELLVEIEAMAVKPAKAATAPRKKTTRARRARARRQGTR